MLSLSLAQQLKAAGLQWSPANNDFFALPERGMDERVFVLSDVMSYVEIVQGHPAVTFHGAVEWALDFVYLMDVVWMPSESQLREELERRLIGSATPALTLTSTGDGYRCDIRVGDQWLAFDAFGASEAYGLALLHLLGTTRG
jgi:hypothetical protein